VTVECGAQGFNVLSDGPNKNAVSIVLGVERNSGMDRDDLANLTAFIAVADQRSFRAAAASLGATPLALSHSMRRLEERLGVRLLNRSTRSASVGRCRPSPTQNFELYQCWG